jgi:beta-glucosidase
MIAHGMGDLQTVSAMALNAGIEMDMVVKAF